MRVSLKTMGKSAPAQCGYAASALTRDTLLDG